MKNYKDSTHKLYSYILHYLMTVMYNNKVVIIKVDYIL